MPIGQKPANSSLNDWRVLRMGIPVVPAWAGYIWGAAPQQVGHQGQAQPRWGHFWSWDPSWLFRREGGSWVPCNPPVSWAVLLGLQGPRRATGGLHSFHQPHPSSPILTGTKGSRATLRPPLKPGEWWLHEAGVKWCLLLTAGSQSCTGTHTWRGGGAVNECGRMG